MLEEKDIEKHCGDRVMRRAKNILRIDNAVHDNTCTRDVEHPTEYIVHAQVASASDWRQSYDVRLKLDVSANEVKGYECTCPAAYSYAGMCKHAVATALEFIARPESFPGYQPEGTFLSSKQVTKLINESASPGALYSSAAEGTDRVLDGSLHLELTLVRTVERRWAARFAVSMSGRRPLRVNNLPAFVQEVKSGTFDPVNVLSGGRCGIASFDEESRPVIRFLQRAIDARRLLTDLQRVQLKAANTLALFDALCWDSDMELAESELIELLELYADMTFYADDYFAIGKHRGRAHRGCIVEGNPPLRVIVEPWYGNGYSVLCDGVEEIIAYAEEAYAWDGERFYHCEKGLKAKLSALRTLHDAASSAPLYLAESDARAFMISVLAPVEDVVELILPEELEAYKPLPCTVELYLDYSSSACTCHARAVYGESSFGIFESNLHDCDVVRDVVTETAVANVLSTFFPVVPGQTKATEEEPLRLGNRIDIASLIFEGLPLLKDIADIYTTPAFDRLGDKRRVDPSVGVTVKSGLIDLKVSSEDFSSEELAGILSSYRQRKRFHQLPDGSLMDLQGQGLDHVSAVLTGLDIDPDAFTDDGEMLLPAYRAFSIDGLLTEDEKGSAFRAALRKAGETPESVAALPQTFDAVLRPYQREGFDWLEGLASRGFGGILADEMGLGKSLQLIAFLSAHAQQGEDVALIACPASLVFNWLAEFEKFAPSMRVAAAVGAKQNRREVVAAAQTGAYDVVVTSYDLLKRDTDLYEDMVFSTVALDEAQYIKNPKTKAATATKGLKSRRRFALTGTPIENRLSELWSIFDFLMPGLLGGYEWFRENFERPIIDGDEAASAKLASIADRFVLRRLKRDVLDDLPAKNVNVVFAQMGTEQQRLYHALEQRLRESLGKQKAGKEKANQIVVLAELTRLREVCCDPRLVYEDYNGDSAKLNTVMELVESARESGEKALVFSQFTSYLELIAEQLRRRNMDFYTITGSTPKKKRVELVDAFNADETPVFLVSLKAGGTGLNLTGASVVIHADPWWNLAAENQATDRSHRIGQTKDVMVYKVIAKDTVEERVVDLQQAKGELADRLIGANAGSNPVSPSELLELLTRE